MENSMPAYKKHASTRARANKASTAATLYPRDASEVVIPTLPDLVDLDGNVIEWRPETLECPCRERSNRQWPCERRRYLHCCTDECRRGICDQER
jgi:hypothetical protein